MKFKYLSVILIATAAIFAQEEPAPAQIPVTKSEAEVENVKYPVFAKVTSVEKGQFGGIRYMLTETNAKGALKKADQVKKFYQNRKIGAAKFGGFKKISKPDTIAWAATAKKGTEVFGVIIKVEDVNVVVYVIPAYEEGVLAMIL